MSYQSVLVGVDGPALEIMCFPGDDLQFVAAVRRIADDIESRVPERDLDTALGARLSTYYPAVRLQRRDALAFRGEVTRIVYAFRDGTASPTRTAHSRDADAMGSVGSAAGTPSSVGD